MGDVNLEIKLNNLDERVIKIEDSGGSGGDSYITSVSNDFNVVNKKLSLSDSITTKLSKVDTTDNLSVELAKKIDKPASSTDGQVLTYNATSGVWEAQDSKGGGAIISDEWVSGGTYSVGDYAIYNNALYKCVGDGGGNSIPSLSPTIWNLTNVGDELKGLIKIYSVDYEEAVSSNNYAIIGTLPAIYQGAKAYFLTSKFNGAYMTGGVNSTLDYSIYIFNNYSVALAFKTIDVICIF